MGEGIFRRRRGITLHHPRGGPTASQAAENFDLPNHELLSECMWIKLKLIVIYTSTAISISILTVVWCFYEIDAFIKSTCINISRVMSTHCREVWVWLRQLPTVLWSSLSIHIHWTSARKACVHVCACMCVYVCVCVCVYVRVCVCACVRG